MTFFKSFSPILIILVLSLLFNIPFHYSVFAGLFLGIVRNIESNNKFNIVLTRLKNFFKAGISYNLLGLILGIMAFKAIVESSGTVSVFAEFLTKTGLPLPLMLILLGLLTGYLTGINIASLGILLPIFLPLIPSNMASSQLALLYISSFIGYTLSPIHLCLILTKEYFDSGFMSVYRYLVIPYIFMIVTGFIQIILYRG